MVNAGAEQALRQGGGAGVAVGKDMEAGVVTSLPYARFEVKIKSSAGRGCRGSGLVQKLLDSGYFIHFK